MSKPIQQIILTAEQTTEMLDRIEELAKAEQVAKIRSLTAETDYVEARRAFIEEANIAASLGVVHRLYPPRSEP